MDWKNVALIFFFPEKQGADIIATKEEVQSFAYKLHYTLISLRSVILQEDLMELLP